MKDSAQSWAPLIESIEKRRDSRAHFFQPTCIVAVCNLFDRQLGTIDALPSKEVISEFARLVQEVFPDRASKGWMPMWHLMESGAWKCKKNGVPVPRTVFPRGKPHTKKEVLDAVDTLDCSGHYGLMWRNERSRDSLRKIMIALLAKDDDLDARLMGEALGLSFNLSGDPKSSRSSDLTDDSDFVIEDHTRSRLHVSIETVRSSALPKAVKRAQGLTCLACGFNFQNFYGELGANYIEAHHVTPVSETKGQVRRKNLQDDFVVLCSNCHKMIHRLGPPWTKERLNDLKKLITQK